jgi:hypothetical protein
MEGVDHGRICGTIQVFYEGTEKAPKIFQPGYSVFRPRIESGIPHLETLPPEPTRSI